MLYVLRPLRSPTATQWNSSSGLLCRSRTVIASNERRDTDWNKEAHSAIQLKCLRIFNKTERYDENKIGTQCDEIDGINKNSKSLSECYFAGKGTALVLPDAEANSSNSRQTGAQGGSSNIQKHLQSMFYLLRPEETLKMAVKLESVHPSRTRYLVVVSRMGTRSEESCLLGIDCNERTTVGLVLKVLADTQITLDGDGGFSVSVCERHHIFKPVSVQAMWSALQTLHKVSAKAREQTYFEGGMTHGWVNYYENRIESDRSCLNEWHAMDNLESKRPPSPDSIRTKPTEREETEKVIRTTLKEIMMSVDLDEVTSKVIRSRLEAELDMDLGEYKSFIDQEILVILGQMDAPTEIFEHVYLGSEWNASNYEELTRNGVGHILNVTREIDNFFPGTFDYLNIRVYDDEKTDLLKHWDDTFKYITKAKDKGSKVLVHCKMGVSRSASVVIAYAMKAYNWDFGTALQHVKEKRSCIKPNTNFLTQLETYQGILDAMKNKEKLQRSKSETNLKSPTVTISLQQNAAKNEIHNEPTTEIKSLSKSSGEELKQLGVRPKSWSPESLSTNDLLNVTKSSPFLSLEDISQKSTSKESIKSVSDSSCKVLSGRHVLMPCDNGESYSVSPNQIFLLPGHHNDEERGGGGLCKKKLVLELATKFEETSSSTNTWDPGEMVNVSNESTESTRIISDCDNIGCVWTSSTTLKNVLNDDVVEGEVEVPRNSSDPFSNQLDRVFDKEEKRAPKEPSNSLRPSRQSSWSSYDSALGYQTANEMLSRHSSWGSGDTRTLPSRNSSWGSYDMRQRGPVHYVNEKGEKVQHSDQFPNSSSGIFAYDKEDIPWLAGTVKRTKQKIEETNTTTSGGVQTAQFERDENSAISEKIDIPKRKGNFNGRLSISAPEASSMETITTKGECELSRSVSNENCISAIAKTFLENVQNNEVTGTRKTDNEKQSSGSGKVRNLKKEYEARNANQIEHAKNRVNSSLPSSPVSLHQEKFSANNDDMNLKSLIGIFENHRIEKEVNLRKNSNVTRARNNMRHSCIEVSVGSPVRIMQTPLIASLNKNENDVARRPPIPVVRTTSPRLMVAATVIATATAKKQQQYGKSHPLAQLNIKSGHNNPVYNTM